MALRPLAENQSTLVGQRLIDAVGKGKVRPALLRAVPNAPEGAAQQTTNRRRERPASEAQAAEGFRECCVQTLKPSIGNDSCSGEEDTSDEVFVRMHAPGEYKETNRSHIAEYDPNASGRSVLTIGSLASQLGSWHSSPTGSRLVSPDNSSGFHEVRVKSAPQRASHNAMTLPSIAEPENSAWATALQQGSWLAAMDTNGSASVPSPMERPADLDLSAGSLHSNDEEDTSSMLCDIDGIMQATDTRL